MTSHTIIYYLRPPPPSKLRSSSMLTVLLWLANFFSFLSIKAEVYSSCFSLPHSSFSNSDLFPLSSNFYVLRRATITCVNKTAMYGRPSVKVNVERGSTFTLTRDLPYIALCYSPTLILHAYASEN